MKVSTAVCCLLLCLGVAGTELAADPPKPTFASVLDHNFTSVEGEFVPAADAMPEDKYGFAPTQGEFKGVRTFAAQVKHVAAVNFILGAAILGENVPAEAGTDESGPAGVKSKAEIMKYLKDSFVYAHKALNSVTEANVLVPIKSPFGPNMTTRLSLAIILTGHPFDHYGQMVEYLRMNGIIPPASRQ